MKKWRIVSIATFTLFTLLELADFGGLVPGYANPTVYADLLGINAESESIRLFVLTILSLSIAITSGATVVGLVFRSKWAARSAAAVGILFLLYSVYQVSFGIVVAEKNRTFITLAGMFYALGGLVAYWLAGKNNSVIELDVVSHELT